MFIKSNQVNAKTTSTSEKDSWRARRSSSASQLLAKQATTNGDIGIAVVGATKDSLNRLGK